MLDKITPALPSPPPCLGEIGAREWARLMGEFGGRLRPMDYAAIGIFCAAFETWSVAQTAIKEHGATTVTPSGYIRQSVHVGIANRAAQTMLKISSDGWRLVDVPPV